MHADKIKSGTNTIWGNSKKVLITHGVVPSKKTVGYGPLLNRKRNGRDEINIFETPKC